MATRGKKPKDPTGKPKRQRRVYSAEDKGATRAVLKAEGGNVKGTARATGLPESTVRGHRDDAGQEVAAAEEKATQTLSDLFENFIRRTIASVTDGDLARASVKDRMWAVGVIFDKRQLCEGKPTDISENINLTPEQRARVARIRAKQSLAAAPAEVEEATTSVN